MGIVSMCVLSHTNPSHQLSDHENLSQLSNTIHTIRTIALLLLPLIYIFIYVPKRSPPLTSLVPALSNAHSTYRLASLARTAIGRDPRLRRSWARVGEAEARAAKVSRDDGGVSDAARELGLVHGEMRGNARRWIDQGWSRMIRVESDPLGDMDP